MKKVNWISDKNEINATNEWMNEWMNKEFCLQTSDLSFE